MRETLDNCGITAELTRIFRLVVDIPDSIDEDEAYSIAEEIIKDIDAEVILTMGGLAHDPYLTLNFFDDCSIKDVRSSFMLLTKKLRE